MTAKPKPVAEREERRAERRRAQLARILAIARSWKKRGGR